MKNEQVSTLLDQIKAKHAELENVAASYGDADTFLQNRNQGVAFDLMSWVAKLEAAQVVLQLVLSDTAEPTFLSEDPHDFFKSRGLRKT